MPLVLLTFVCGTSSINAQILKPIGINLSGITDYSTEFVFTDAMKQSRSWISFDSDGNGSWSSGVNVPLNEKGYPIKIPYNNGTNPPQSVRTLMIWDLDTATPLGQFRLIVQGNGSVQLRAGANGTFACPVDTILTVTGGVILSIELSDSANPISDIKFIYPKYVNTYNNKTFTDEFIGFVNDFQTLRFMDWLGTNNSEVTTWNDRGNNNYFTQTIDNGVAWEYIIELCNQTNKNAWINIPHKADSGYIANVAKLLDEQLDPALKIYLEFSNEVWNSIFSQNSYATNAATALGYTGANWEKAWKYTAKRSADVFNIFNNQFANKSRLIKVIPSQAANSWLSNQIITYFENPTYNPTQIKADVLAIAPYFGGNAANNLVRDNKVNSASMQEIMDSIHTTLAQTYTWMKDNNTVAINHKLKLMCYEGGQHVVATGNNVNNDALTSRLIAANHHPDMQNMYCEYFKYWYDSIGNDFIHFSSHYKYNKYGSWGVKETMTDTLNPKYLGLKSCVFAYNKPTKVSTLAKASSWSIYPNPAKNHQLTINGVLNITSLKVYDAMGKEIPVEIVNNENSRISISMPVSGLCIVNCDNKSERVLVE